MGRREVACQEYRDQLAERQARLEDLVERGTEALSDYDVKVAHGGDAERALWMALYLTGNHVRSFTERVQECAKVPRQATLFEAPDAHLEMQYEDQQSGFEDH